MAGFDLFCERCRRVVARVEEIPRRDGVYENFFIHTLDRDDPCASHIVPKGCAWDREAAQSAGYSTLTRQS